MITAILSMRTGLDFVLMVILKVEVADTVELMPSWDSCYGSVSAVDHGSGTGVHTDYYFHHSCEYVCGNHDDKQTLLMVAIQTAMMCLLLLIVK